MHNRGISDSYTQCDMDDRKIEIFLAVERCGSLSAAARQCFCTQSAATQAMDALEAELGVHLLDRGPSGVSLTEAGTRLSPRAHEVADALARLKAAAAAERGEAEVRVGAYSSIAAAWLPAAIARMSQAEPGLRAYVRTGTQAVREWLLSGEVDVALGDDSLLDPSRPDVREAMRGTAVRWVPIAEDPFLAVLPEDEAWGTNLRDARRTRRDRHRRRSSQRPWRTTGGALRVGGDREHRRRCRHSCHGRGGGRRDGHARAQPAGGGARRHPDPRARAARFPGARGCPHREIGSGSRAARSLLVLRLAPGAGHPGQRDRRYRALGRNVGGIIPACAGRAIRMVAAA